MIGLSEHTRFAQEDFERAMQEAVEVKECHNVTGVFEYLIRVEVQDLESYKHFHTYCLGSIPQVKTINTYI